MELCQILGISINEFLAGEDIEQADMVKTAESNLIQVATDSKHRQKRLKKIIAVLLVVALAAVAVAGAVLFGSDRPKNSIAPIPDNSVEMKTAQLLSGVDGAHLFRFNASDSFKSLTIYVSKYRNGELVDQSEMGADYETVGSPKEGIVAIVPDFNTYTVKLILADSGTKLSWDIPILEGEDENEAYGRACSRIDDEIPLLYGQEQGLAALVCGKEGITVQAIDNFADGTAEQYNEYVCYFSFKFSK